MPFSTPGKNWRGTDAADDLLGELDAPARVRLELSHTSPNIAVAAGLLLVPAVDLGRAPDRLAVGDLGRAGHDRRAELALQPLGDDGDWFSPMGPQHLLAGLGCRSTRAVGSSSSIRWSAGPSLSRSALVWGSIANGSVGSGNADRVEGSGFSRPKRVARLGDDELGDRTDLAGLAARRWAPAPCHGAQHLADALLLAPFVAFQTWSASGACPTRRESR